jgi:hypothetical protein
MTSTVNTSPGVTLNGFFVKNVLVVLGAQWGDEGKGKLVDVIGQEAEICARFAVRTRQKRKNYLGKRVIVIDKLVEDSVKKATRFSSNVKTAYEYLLLVERYSGRHSDRE